MHKGLMYCLIISVFLWGGCAKTYLPTSGNTSPPPAEAQPCQITPNRLGETHTIQVVLVRIPKEDVEIYPELLEKRVGFGINSILVETLFDTQYFRFLEEKEQILGRLVQQRIVTEDGIFYKDKIGEGLLAPEFLAYAEIYGFVACSREEIIKLQHRMITCKTQVGVQVRIVDTATSEYVPGSATGEHTQKTKAEGIWGSIDLPFDQSAVGQATWKATCGAVKNVLTRFDRLMQETTR